MEKRVMTSFLDPTAELAPQARAPLPKRDSLVGLNVALLDISKPRGNVFIDRLSEMLKSAGAQPRRYAKPTFTRIAPVELKQQIATECDVVIEALAD
jgi:3-hydroxyacyl-CoA dehydrogenase